MKGNVPNIGEVIDELLMRGIESVRSIVGILHSKLEGEK
jgi:hypothetical protein